MKKSFLKLSPLLIAALMITSCASAQLPHNAKILAHRGVHQTYSAENLDRDTCTANRIDTPKHDFIENTIPSILETIKLGADIIEIDVHPTTDGDFAVFHDWTLDCRTEAKGVTREQSMADLRKLDVGYGYTADGGKTFPLRGKGVGMMPDLDDVLKATNNIGLLINIKSRDPKEGEKLGKYLIERNVPEDKITVYGHETPIASFHKTAPQYVVFSKQSMKDCTKQYIFNAWYGGNIEKCRDGVLGMPITYRFLYAGHNKNIVARLKKLNAQVYVMGPMKDSKGQRMIGIDDPKYLKNIPDGAIIFTNKVEEIAPVLKAK